MRFAMMMPFMSADTGGGGSFGGGAGEGGASPSGPVSFESTTPPVQDGPPTPTIQNPLRVDPTQVQPPAVEPTSQELLDFGGRKVPALDPVLKDLHQDYQHLTSTYQQTNQQNQVLQQQLQTYQQLLQQMQQQTAQPAQPAAPQLTPEQIAERNQQWMDSFYENPMNAIQQIIQESIKPALQPLEQIQKERQYQAQIADLSQKFSDFQDLVPAMQQLNTQNPNLVDQFGLENLYWLAKGQAAQQTQQQQQVYTPETALADPNFRNQVISNPEIQQAILSQYLQNKQQQALATPPVMGAQAGGQVPFTPPAKPTNMAEATKQFKDWLTKQN